MSLGCIFGGVDPGFTGAIAQLEDVEGEELSEVWDMPTRQQGTKKRVDRDRARIILVGGEYDCTPRRLVYAVEAVGAMGGKKNRKGEERKEGTSSQFRFGQGQGEILGILTGIGATVFEVPASVWKMRCGLIGMGEKEVCKRAARLFPGHVLIGPKGGALHGRAEALFLAAYARLVVEGKAIDDR